MFKIKGYLKKFWYLILACICLLFVQAQTELTLPDYMSDIVSVGIQAGGFASPVSDVLSEETYQHLLLFVDQKDQKTVKKDLSESRESFSAIFVLGQVHLRQSDLKTAKMAEKI